MDTLAYRMISDHYGNRRAARSGMRLMNHIDEGIEILSYLGADQDTKDAFCLHPLVQGDVDLLNTFVLYYDELPQLGVRPVLAAMEYRSVANAYLLPHLQHVSPDGDLSFIRLSPLPHINMMLIADKVQNYKDFRRYNSRHPRYDDLDLYFRQWLRRLGVRDRLHERLVCATDAAPHFDNL